MILGERLKAKGFEIVIFHTLFKGFEREILLYLYCE